MMVVSSTTKTDITSFISQKNTTNFLCLMENMFKLDKSEKKKSGMFCSMGLGDCGGRELNGIDYSHLVLKLVSRYFIKTCKHMICHINSRNG
jgi:hypothetical protein